MPGPIRFAPGGDGDEVAFRINWGAGCWIQTGFVGDAGADGFGHGVVDGEDGVFGDVGAGLGDLAIFVGDGGAFDVFAFDDGEGFHDVLDGVARRGEHLAELWAVVAPFFGRAEVQMEVRGIQLAPQQKPTLLIPTKRRPVVTAVQCKWFQVPCRVCQFENAWKKPFDLL